MMTIAAQQREWQIWTDEMADEMALKNKHKSTVRFFLPHRTTTVVAGLAFFLLAALIAEPCVAQLRGRRAQRNAAGAGVTAEAVRQSVAQGVAYLKDKRTRNGSWAKYTGVGDVTALATLALLNAGVDPESPTIQGSLDYIESSMDSSNLTTYSAGLKIMTLAAADPEGRRYLREVERTVEWLVNEQLRSGGWSYGLGGRGARGDASNTQFAILGLHEASKMGVKINQRVWERAQEYWKACYVQGGGFGYKPNDGRAYPAMTCAGISSWIIIDENLADFRKLVKGDRAVCCGGDDRMGPVEKSIERLGQNFGVRSGNGVQYYYLYALERAGRLAGQRFFGPHDWYRAGAKTIVEKQNKITGAWRGSALGEQNEVIATSMSLLFLAKGKRPVAIGKYQYGDTEQWNQHPKGVHYLTRELEKQWETKLNWQTVRSADATVDNLLESPVLHISGSEFFELTEFQKENLKKYIETGGFIFAEACDGEGCRDGSGFDLAFRELMAELFPESDLQPLPQDHPLWTAHFSIVPNAERPLLGLQACCRTSVVYCPKNLSCYWNIKRPAFKTFLKKNPNAKLEQRVNYCAELGVNVIAYATGRQLREKGETPKLEEENATTVLVNRSLNFPKLIHTGGSDEAPNAWKNMLKTLEAVGLQVSLEKKMVNASIEQMADYPIIFMHGRSEFRFDEAQREAIGAYLESGGFIFVDAICSNEPFRESLHREVQEITGERLKPIPKDHAMWSSKYSGQKVDRVELRIKDASAEGGFRKSIVTPEFEGLELNGRLVIAHSKFDLSCAMENVAVSQCDGYTRSDAERIAYNVLIYALRVD